MTHPAVRTVISTLLLAQFGLAIAASPAAADPGEQLGHGTAAAVQNGTALMTATTQFADEMRQHLLDHAACVSQGLPATVCTTSDNVTFDNAQGIVGATGRYSDVASDHVTDAGAALMLSGLDETESDIRFTQATMAEASYHAEFGFQPPLATDGGVPRFPKGDLQIDVELSYYNGTPQPFVKGPSEQARLVLTGLSLSQDGEIVEERFSVAGRVGPANMATFVIDQELLGRYTHPYQVWTILVESPNDPALAGPRPYKYAYYSSTASLAGPAADLADAAPSPVWACIDDIGPIPAYADEDGDGIDDACDFDLTDGPTGDADGDGVQNQDDICPGFDDADDADGDGHPDGCDAHDQDGPLGDLDGDGVQNQDDICPGHDDNADLDGDGIPDGCDGDTDGDGIADGDDVCDGDDQVDTDGDEVPDDCDTDDDGDGLLDTEDACPGHDDRADADADNIPDGCDSFDGRTMENDDEAPVDDEAPADDDATIPEEEAPDDATQDLHEPADPDDAGQDRSAGPEDADSEDRAVEEQDLFEVEPEAAGKDTPGVAPVLVVTTLLALAFWRRRI